MALLSVEGLKMYYTTMEGQVKAVDGIDFQLEQGEVLGIVGESGCGKSSLASTLLMLLPKNAKVIEGKVLVPQGAMNGLNPIFKVGDQISEAITTHTSVPARETRQRVSELLHLVAVDPSWGRRYQHEFSGGMKQRAMIAMSLALNPKILIADEPTTALDVIVQAGIIRLLLSIRSEFKTSIILITHDLALVAQMSEKTAIMYAGKFVEYGSTKEVYKQAAHPYTLGLLEAFADIRKPKENLTAVPGSPPDLITPPTGCRFHPRCPYAKSICSEVDPVPEKVSETHVVACHLWKEIREMRRTRA